jgi:hypothetical protein
MSYDQRPGKMRVVGDSAAAQQARRSGDAANAAATAVVENGAVAAGAAGSAAAARAKGGVSLLGILMFLIACAIGGALFAAFNPLGLG